MTVRTFHHDDEEYDHLQSINAELLAALENLLSVTAHDLRPEGECGPTKTAVLLQTRAAIAKAKP